MTSAAEEEVKARLDSFGQSHIYKNLDNFDENHPVFKQVQRLDLKESLAHYASAKAGSLKEGSFIPVRQDRVHDYRDPSLSERKAAIESIGLQAIADGTVAAVIMSGGQGTRLGYDGPKGMFPLNLPSKKPIFRLHMERIRKVKELASKFSSNKKEARIPVYIMTSDLNHKIIEEYFAAQNYFEYPREDIVFFEQGLEPAFTHEGKIILESAQSLSLSPDGNGGLYKAVKRECIRDMLSRGIEHLHVYGIDNVLTKSLDPLFIGTCIEQNAQVGNKVVWRASASEKVGVTAELDGRMHILEYSEIPANLVSQVDPSTNKLAFGAANICNHYLSVDFLVNTVFQNLSSSYHFADKKIPYYDTQTKSTVVPTKPNGIKLEMFIFDVFPLAERWVLLETDRQDEFAPVKNESGVDSPETARIMMSEQGVRWLKAAGASVEYQGGDTSGSICEISPLLSYAGEGLERYSGEVVRLPCELKP